MFYTKIANYFKNFSNLPCIRNNIDYTAVITVLVKENRKHNFKEKKPLKEIWSDESDCLINSILTALLIPEAISLEPKDIIFLLEHPFP